MPPQAQPGSYQSGGTPYGEHPPEAPSTSTTSPGVIIGIIAAILVVFIGLPLLVCGACIAFTRYETAELAEQIEADVAKERRQAEEERRLREQARLDALADRLQERAKLDIREHWNEPEGVRRRRWADWTARKITDHRYEVSGALQLSVKDQGSQTYEWACQYSTSDDAHSPHANWKLEAITIDGKRVYSSTRDIDEDAGRG